MNTRPLNDLVEEWEKDPIRKKYLDEARAELKEWLKTNDFKIIDLPLLGDAK